jgi:hypothetical protein
MLPEKWYNDYLTKILPRYLLFSEILQIHQRQQSLHDIDSDLKG